MTADALVVVDEVAATVQDQPLAMDLEGARIMREMAVNDGDAGIDQRMRERALVAADRIARSPPQCQETITE